MGGCADEQRARLMFGARGKTEQMTQKGLGMDLMASLF